MNDIKLELNKIGRGAFIIEGEGHEQLADMEIAIANGNLTVFHTEVSEKLKGQGIGLKLIGKMVDYARENQLKIIPLCTFVSAQFQRHPDQYTDVWNKTWHK